MITGMAGIGSYSRPAQIHPSKTFTTADARPATDTGTTTENAEQRIPVSSLNVIDTSKLKTVSIKDNPELRDQVATNWLNMQAAQSTLTNDVPDNAPQNVYATVKVNGAVVATLYNGGTSIMTNDAAAKVGDLQDPPGLQSGGPDLAEWRAESIAKATGGTIEKASTAITQSEWTPRPDVSRDYTRAQLDAAYQAMMAEGQNATAQRLLGYAPPQSPTGAYTNFNA